MHSWPGAGLSLLLGVGLFPGGCRRQLLRSKQTDAGPDQEVVQPGALEEAPDCGAVVDPQFKKQISTKVSTPNLNTNDIWE